MQSFDIHDDRFQALILPNARLELLGQGFRWLEGPVWFADLDCLLVSDLPNDRIMRWSQSGGISLFRQPSGFANGHTRDRQGRLLGCSHLHRCITRTELDGAMTILADRYQGRRLNAPNDIIVKHDGTIWFTDPLFGISTDYEGGRQISEAPARVYRLDPADGALSIVVDDLAGPNGLCFSPAETKLYITEAGPPFAAHAVQHIIEYEVTSDGDALGRSKIFHKIQPGFADGIKCDEYGNIWSSAGNGVHCIASDGQLLGIIKTGSVVSNIAFGGPQRSRLFICAGDQLFAIFLNCRGVTFP
jgi:gluconolactonase